MKPQHPVVHNAAHEARLHQVHQHFAAHEQRGQQRVVRVHANILPHNCSPHKTV